MNKREEIIKYINGLKGGMQLGTAKIFIDCKINTEIAKYYNQYKKSYNDIIEIPKEIVMSDDLTMGLEKLKLKDINKDDIKIKGFRCTFLNPDEIDGLSTAIDVVYSDNSISPMSDSMKLDLLDYFSSNEERRQEKEAAMKGCDFVNEDIIITDPCYILDYDDTDCYKDLHKVGINDYVIHSTIYGDWSCTVFNTDDYKTILGEFCADSGMVCIVPLKDAIRLNSGYDKIKDKEWTRTIIHNFTGHVYLDFKTYGDDGAKYEYVEVVGKGNVNFRSNQTGI